MVLRHQTHGLFTSENAENCFDTRSRRPSWRETFLDSKLPKLSLPRELPPGWALRDGGLLCLCDGDCATIPAR